MGFLERLENLIQSAVEGGTNSVLRQKLTLVEIENHLQRAMRDHTRSSGGDKLAPNTFTVFLHPDAYRETVAGVHGYNRRCEMLLNQYASQQRFTLLQPRITVTFDTDAGLGRREVSVRAGFDAPQGADPVRHTPPGPASSGTRTQVFAPPPRLDSPWRIQVIRGRDVNQVFTIPEGETTVGRSPDSGIVLWDEKNTVSRHHAAFIARGNELRVRDVGSKNGTKVNGNYVPDRLETLVADGAEIAFGECVVRVRFASGGER